MNHEYTIMHTDNYLHLFIFLFANIEVVLFCFFFGQ